MADRKNTKKQTKAGKKPVTSQTSKNSGSIISDFFRMGESYTSLVLGIVVVIAAAALLVSLSKTRENASVNPSQDISATSTVREPSPTLTREQIASLGSSESPAPTKMVTKAKAATQAPTNAPRATATSVPSVTALPTMTKTPTITAKPTITPTQVPSKKPTPTVTKTQIAQVTTVPTKAMVPTITPQKQAGGAGKTYTVQPGDDLWSIAERVYGNGYAWSDISKANKLANPNVIAVGSTIQLPERSAEATVTPTTIAKQQVTPKAPDQLTQKTTGPPAGSITGTSYTVVPGDDLWDIAVRAYGSGYKWTDIAKANNLTHPNLIHRGNVLTLPR